MKHLFLYDEISYSRVDLLRELFHYVESYDENGKHNRFQENLDFSVYLHDMVYDTKYSFERNQDKVVFKNEYKEIFDKEIAKMLLTK